MHSPFYLPLEKMIGSGRDVKTLIQQGEGLTLEYKREVSSPHKIAKLMIAFSNSRGGRILIGVSNQGVIMGVSNINLQKQYIISAAKYFCDPPVSPHIETVSLDGRKILIVTIKESQRKPHRWVKNNEKIETYIRVKDKNYIASEPTIRDLQERSRVGKKSLGRSEVNKEVFIISHLRDHERITVKELSEMLNISKRRALRILVSLRKKGKIFLHDMGRQEFYTLA